MLRRIPIVLVSALWAVGGCRPTEFVGLPPIPDRGSVLLVATERDRSVTMSAADGPNAAAELPFTEDSTLWALIYPDQDLFGMGLFPGRVQLKLQESQGRPLSPNFRLFIKPRLGLELEEALPEDELNLGEILGPRPLPNFSGDDCFGPQPCQLFSGIERDLYCEPQCPLAAPEAPLPPIAPELPALDTCPPGWLLNDRADLAPSFSLCAPAPRGSSCPDGSIQTAGGAACEAISTCPGSRFADAPGPKIYVDPSAAAGGDGTLARPLISISAVPPGAELIMLSAGQHSLPPSIRGRRLMGVCARDTVVSTPLLALENVELEGLRLQSDRVEVQADVLVRNSQLAVATLQTTAGSNLSFERVRWESDGSADVGLRLQATDFDWIGGSLRRVAGAGSIAISASGGRLDIEDVAFDTVEQAAVPVSDLFVLSSGSTASVSRSSIKHAATTLRALDGSRAILNDVAIDGLASGSLNTSLVVESRARLVANRLVLQDAFRGLRVSDGSVDATNALFERLQRPAALINSASVFTGDHVLVSDNAGSGIFVLPGPKPIVVTLSDLIVQGASNNCFRTEVNPPEVEVAEVTLNIMRASFRGCGSDGVRLAATRPGASKLSDVRIEDCGGAGLIGPAGSAAHIERLHVKNVAGIGVVVQQVDFILGIGTIDNITTLHDIRVDSAQRGATVTASNVSGQRWQFNNSCVSGLRLTGVLGGISDLHINGVSEQGRPPDAPECVPALNGETGTCLGVVAPPDERGVGLHVCVFGRANVAVVSDVTVEHVLIEAFIRLGVSVHTAEGTWLNHLHVRPGAGASAGFSFAAANFAADTLGEQVTVSDGLRFFLFE